MGINAVNVGAGNIGSVGQAAGGNPATEVEEADKLKLELEATIQAALMDAMKLILATLGNLGAALNVKIQKKLDSIDELTKLLNGLDKWNAPPVVPKMPVDPDDPVYKDRLDKTDELLLNGVSIPQEDYDAVRYSYGSPPVIGYATLPVQDIRKTDPKFLVDGQLYWAPTNGSLTEKTYYRCVGNDRVLKEVGPPVAYKSKDEPGNDFSKFEPGDLVKDKETQKFYRVANDKTGVEVEGYPLQGFILSPNSDVLYDLKNRIDNKLVEVRDLSKSDSLEAQKLSGLVSTTTSEFSNMLAAVVNVCNTTARNI